jgi:short subunit dehydrogenase-like uncharacterized protein
MLEPWLIYGAYGFTGTLVAEEAVRRGHRPVLAGRSRSQLEPLAQRLGLELRVLDLDDEEKLAQALRGFALVFHAAGPFARTSEPMVRACLRAGAHYVDITGEVSVFERNFAHDREARERGVAIVSGVGFDVVPSDCAAKLAADQVPGATELEIGFIVASRPSAGTTRTMIEGIPQGTLVRRDGAIRRIREGKGIRTIRFADFERAGLPVAWGDISTAYRSTGIPNITTYMGVPRGFALAMRLFGPLARHLLSWTALRKLLQAWVARAQT